MSPSIVFGLVILAVLVGVHFSRQHSLRFSSTFWIQLLAYSAAFGVGLLLGNIAFVISLIVVVLTLTVKNRAPRPVDAKEREALRQRASGDLHAAKRLRRLLEEEMKWHGTMRDTLLLSVSAEEKVQARAMIEERERQTQVELEMLEETIQRLKPA